MGLHPTFQQWDDNPSRSWTLNQLGRPGAPNFFNLKIVIITGTENNSKDKTELCPVASSADISPYMRTSFLMSNYHSWTGHNVLWNVSKRRHSFGSTLAVHIKTPGTWKGKLPRLIADSLPDPEELWETHRWHLYRKLDRSKQWGRDYLVTVRGCLLLPTGRPSSGLPAKASHLDSQPSIPRSPKLFGSLPRSAVKPPKKTNLSGQTSR